MKKIMCGIVGYAGDGEALPILLDGLSRLEYRGYDSAGICVSSGSGTTIVKAKGRLSALEEKIKIAGKISGNTGIGHTRWATHGAPSDINAHPHSYGKITVVHNGIVENYVSLRTALIESGEKFLSETDTEVIAHLINKYYGKDPTKAITQALSEIKGSAAICVMFDDVPGKIYAARCDSPLIVGLGEGENFIASDIPAILKRTKRYYIIDEGEIATVSKDDVSVTGFDGLPRMKQEMTAEWNVESAEKSGYRHFMLKEIYEQPKAIRSTIESYMMCGVDGILKDVFPATFSVKRIKMVACGSAMHAAMLGKYAMEAIARIPVDVYIASEFRYCNPVFEEGSIVILISQSGETADTLSSLRLAKRNKIPTYALVNTVGSSIAREADFAMYTMAGMEIAVATTKAYTAQASLLTLLALRLAADRNTVKKEDAVSLINAFKSLPAEIEKALSLEKRLQKLAKVTSNACDIFFIGRGQDYAVCLEGSLKLKEISYVHSEAYAAGELKHGTISLITQNMPVVAVITDKSVAEKTASNIKEVKARGAYVIFIAEKSCVASLNPDEFCDEVILFEAENKFTAPIICAAILQLYAYHTALLRGCDIDKPRNLAKSVTVE